MHDLTQGSVNRHLIALSSFMAVSMLFQTLYYLADLYFVGRLGKDAIAAVGLAGNLMIVVLAITQTLGVGTTTLVSHAVGQKDHDRAGLVFNQAFVLSLVVGFVVAVLGLVLRGPYCRWLGADEATARLGIQYLNWFIPAMLLQFVIVAMGAALRGSGVMKPTVGIQILTVVLNILLAPGLIRGFGAAAQAGFGIGARVMQSMFLPVVAISFAAAPLAGQNFGARRAERVRETFRSASLLVSAFMIVFTILSHIAPETLIGAFSNDPDVISFGGEYLRVISYNFLAMGLIFTSSSMFQGMGHTLPPLACSSMRLLLFALPAFLISRRAGFEIRA